MLSVVIPVKDMHESTEECVESLRANAQGPLDIIIVDNNSEFPVPETISNVKVIKNNKNIGFWPSMLQGIQHAESDYVLMMHNDVFVYEKFFDRRIITEFILDDKLAAVGFFGARGVDLYGGRGFPEGNMQGLQHGTAQSAHGHELEGDHPAVVFDSLAICIKKSILTHIEPETIPPHHWTDRVLCLRIINSGHRCLTMGISFDHGGGYTSTTSSMDSFSRDWCLEKGLELEETWEKTLYNYGANLFRHEFLNTTKGKGQLWVDKDYRYYVR